ncbi:MAG: CRISPR-associated endonuclease Cas3'', partial [Candidatus Aenigmarchaeota archaeon]|nr:CRISPR-associated endonuclease Cas3'' [Candidatus Aenigmarchaeota archaeon]
MKLINLLRAKSGNQENFLLRDHILETLRRTKQLKEFVENNTDSITYPYFKDDDFFMSLALALILHDLGKINYDFQRIVYKDKDSGDHERWKNLERILKQSKNVNIKDHEVLSGIWASFIIDKSKCKIEEWIPKIRTAVLLHHYNGYYIGKKDLMEIVVDDLESVRAYLDFMIDNWAELSIFLKDLIDSIHEEFKEEEFILNAIKVIEDELKIERAKKLLEMVKSRDDDISEFAKFYEIDNENPDYDFFVFLGCLRRCDYSASGQVKIEEEVVLKELYRAVESNIKEKINAPLWQEKLLGKIDGESSVLIAPTGSGKTEFAFLWVKNIGKKLIYTLPLRVALNDLFKRFNGYAPNGDENIGLLHSTAFMEYVTEEEKGLEIDIEKKLSSAKILSSPLLLSTPDQVFLTSLNYYGSDKVISIYPFSAFVIDEIQTYNPEMASIIIKTLKIIEKLGGKILVMTATLPPYYKPFFFATPEDGVKIEDKYAKVYHDHRLRLKKLDTESIKEEVKNYIRPKRHKIKVVDGGYLVDENLNVNENDLMMYLKKLIESGKKNNFIVVNNVS